MTLIEELLKNNYHVMVLKLFTANMDLKLAYMEVIEKRNKKLLENCDFVDAGFDLFNPRTLMAKKDLVTKMDFEIKCSAQMILSESKKTISTGYYLYPRSSISKTPLRLANSVGIIDAGYRGNIMAMFDSHHDYEAGKMERFAQICAPSLCPIVVELVDKEEDLSVITERGGGGFGSTGK
jgi:dUTPase